MIATTYDAAARIAAATLPEPDVTPRVGAKVLVTPIYGAEWACAGTVERVNEQVCYALVACDDGGLRWYSYEECRVILCVEAAGVR